jgi:YfiH family protein
MQHIIYPDIFPKSVRVFFTGKLSAMPAENISRMMDIEISNIYLPIQKHTDTIHILNADMSPVIADAVVTNRRGVFIGIQVADCTPVLLYDEERLVVGAVHAGWRGTAVGILKNTINVMQQRFYSSPQDLKIAIGPAIRWCCYEVGYEVIEAVAKETGAGDYYKTKGSKYCMDIPSANRIQALSVGVKKENIWMSDECTFCLPEKYYSYRYAKGGVIGRQCGFIGIV